MGYPLDGAAAKVKRAEEHLEAIDAEVQAFLNGDPQPYFTQPEFDSESGEHIVRLYVRRKPPTRLSAMIGDCLNNLRSALDHVAWQLVLINNEIPDRRTEFPIFKDEAPYGSQSPQKIRGIAPEHQAIIEGLQPYRADDPTGEPLWVLHDLAAIDKHQVLHLVGGTIQGTSSSLLTHGATIETVSAATDGPFEDGAVVHRFTIDPPDAKVDMHFGMGFAIHFDPGGPARGAQVVRTLGVLGEAVTETISLFRPPLR